MSDHSAESVSQKVDEAIAVACQLLPAKTGTVEIRPIFEAEDFGEALTPELQEQEKHIQAETERLQKP